MSYEPWVEEVWANYVSDAATYGGDPPRIALGADLEGDAVRFWVRDNGAGLDARERAAAIAPFERAHDGRAHGLVSIVRRIVTKLGGSCGVEGEPGGGCRFWSTLPAA